MEKEWCLESRQERKLDARKIKKRKKRELSDFLVIRQLSYEIICNFIS